MQLVARSVGRELSFGLAAAQISWSELPASVLDSYQCALAGLKVCRSLSSAGINAHTRAAIAQLRLQQQRSGSAVGLQRSRSQLSGPLVVRGPQALANS